MKINELAEVTLGSSRDIIALRASNVEEGILPDFAYENELSVPQAEVGDFLICARGTEDFVVEVQQPIYYPIERSIFVVHPNSKENQQYLSEFFHSKPFEEFVEDCYSHDGLLHITLRSLQQLEIGDRNDKTSNQIKPEKSR